MANQVDEADDTSEAKNRKLSKNIGVSGHFAVLPGLNYDAPFKVSMPSSQLRDLDLVKWLDNKLGDNNELWSGRQAASLLSREMLVELETCFQALEPHVKLKIVLAVPHLSYRLITMWKEPLINLLDLARRDADDWIETVADMYREYPNRQCIIPIPSNADSYFCKSLDELRKIVRKHAANNNLRLLPLDLNSVSQSAIKTRFGLTEIENRKHFNLKRRAKSYTLKAELLKSAEIGYNRNKNQKLDVVSPSFPIRMRSTVRKPNNDLPMRGIPTTNTCKLSAGFTNEPRKFQRQLTRREGGAKFIDIGDLPQALSVRRKEQEAEERSRRQQEKEEQKKRALVEKTVKEAKRAAIAAQKAKEAAAVAAVDDVAATMNETVSSSVQNNHTLNHHENNNSVNNESSDSKQETSKLSSSYGDVREVPTIQSEQSQEPQMSPSATHLSRRESFARRQCEEMLSCANVLNDEGHRMVSWLYVFDAVDSENVSVHPYPHLGDLLTLKLSETYEDEPRPDGTVQKMRVETFFQMDYRTGEWKRLRKTRALRPEEIRIL
ncbi:Negative elongation factor A [Dirofilaria immitis]|nr:Negative elongation factor A [Dirofilaria immitis]